MGQWLINAVDFANENDGALLVLLTLVYDGTTALIFYANLSSVKEMQKNREEENRPYIIVYLRYLNNGGVDFVVKNIGKTLAKDVDITSDIEINHPKKRPLSKSNLLNNKIPNMAPDFDYSGFLGMVWDLKDEEGNYPTYVITVSYTNNKNENYEEEYVLDFNVNLDLSNLVQKNLHDLTKEFKSYRRDSIKIMNKINDSVLHLSQENEARKKEPRKVKRPIKHSSFK